MNDIVASDLPTRFGFLLLHNFTHIALASAVEPLRSANIICQRNHFSWTTLSESGDAVSASNGLSINVDCGIDNKEILKSLDAVIVCSGRHVEKNTSTPVLRWLKTLGQSRIALGAICTGSYVLAKAGLLDNYRCSIHWENMGSLADLFQKVLVSRSVFSIDRDRYTSSGGISPVDMMLYFIAAKCGTNVSSIVADQIIYEHIRQTDDTQRVPLRHVIGNLSGRLVVAVELMQANIKEPISQDELASYAGLSRRQLQRLFQRYFTCTPSKYYLQLRLQRARELLRQTHMSLEEISIRTGFVSMSHFSKSYKEFYSYSPSSERH